MDCDEDDWEPADDELDRPLSDDDRSWEEEEEETEPEPGDFCFDDFDEDFD